MTEEELQRLKALADAATHYAVKRIRYHVYRIDADGELHSHSTFVGGTDDAQWYVAARSAVPALVAEVEQLNRRNAELAEQLRLTIGREAAAHLLSGRINERAASKVKELRAEVERLMQAGRDMQQQRDEWREEAERLRAAMRSSATLDAWIRAAGPTAEETKVAQQRSKDIAALYAEHGSDTSTWPAGSLEWLKALRADQDVYDHFFATEANSKEAQP